MAENIREQIAALRDAQIISIVGETMFSRGYQYFINEHVLHTDEEPELAGGISAVVLGNGRSYRVVINSLHPFYATCGCPVRVRCKHIAATLLAVRAESSSWREQLYMLGSGRHVNNANQHEPEYERLGLRLERTKTGIKLRPLRQLRAGNWTPNQMSWNQFAQRQRPGARTGSRLAVPAHRAALQNFMRQVSSGYRSPHEGLTLRDLGSMALALLAQAAQAGVELFWQDTSHPLEISADPWEVCADVTLLDSGDLQVRILALGADGRRVEVLENTKPLLGLLVTDNGAILGALPQGTSKAVAALLCTNHPISVPQKDRLEFETAFLPSLEKILPVSSRDDSYHPCRVSPPRLCLEVSRPESGYFEITAKQQVSLEGSAEEMRGAAENTAPETTLAAEASTAASEESTEADAAPAIESREDGVEPQRESQPEAQPEPQIAPIADYLALRDDIETCLRLWENSAVGGAPTSLRSALLLSQFHTSAAEINAWGSNTTNLNFEQFARFQGELAPRLEEAGIRVFYADGAQLHISHEKPVIETRIQESNDWLDLGIVVTIGDFEVPLPELYEALTNNYDYVIRGDVMIPLGPDFDPLRALLSSAAALGEVTPKTVRVPTVRAHALYLSESQLTASKNIRKKLRELEHLGDPEPLPEHVSATLRGYQQNGYAWLTHLARANFGGVLADDMGLGKTLQVLTMIQRLQETGEREGPVLIVAPTSVVSNWQAEAQKFTPQLRVQVVRNSAKRRRESIPELASSADIVVTSYTLARIDAKEYRRVQWGGVVADEAQAIKNPATNSYKAIADLRRPWTFAVTGTPIENSLGDLAALLYLTAPGLLPNRTVFWEKFRKPIERRGDQEATELLQRLVHPFIMRRRKNDVAQDLPEKVENTILVELTPKHMRRYRQQLERERQEVLGLIEDVDHNRISILASLTRLRRLAIDPGLFDEKAGLSESAKTERLVEHLQELLPEGHQVLVFSQFTSYLERIARRLGEAGISYSYLDGSTRDRDGAIASFREGENPVFLISLKAGGTGLNLVEADYVYIMDPWWNPAAEEQAIDRSHRIGQGKQVMVYRLVSQGTIEEKVVALQDRKRSLAGIVNSGADRPITAADMRALLSDVGSSGGF